MSVKETPLAKVKRLHGSKEKLVDSLVEKLAKDSDESDSEMKQRLMTVSNKKLARLAAAMTLLDEKYGGKDQLVEVVCQARGKAKDQDYRAKLASYSVPRLLDLARAS
jgi:hypothetical protein